MGMVAYEHLCQVIEKLSILLIRTDRGIYKKKNIDRRSNIIAKSITMSAMHKNRKSAIVPSINLSYLNNPARQGDNPTQRVGGGQHTFKTLNDDYNPCRYEEDDDVCAQSVSALTDLVNMQGIQHAGPDDNPSQFTSPVKSVGRASVAWNNRGPVGFSRAFGNEDDRDNEGQEGIQSTT